MTADIVRLPATSKPRTPLEIEAELRALVGRMRELAYELAAAQGVEPAATPAAVAVSDETLSLQRAAHAIGWSERRLRRHVVQHNRLHPRDPLGYQPGGMAKTAWCIPMARLHRYVRDQRD